MKPIDLIARPLKQVARWATLLICCIPLLAIAEEKDRDKQALRRGAEATSATKERLATTTIAHVKLDKATMEDAISMLRKELLAPDLEYPVAGYPVQFKVIKPPHFQPKPVTLEMKDASAQAVIDKVADLAGMTARVNLTLVTFWPPQPGPAETDASASAAGADKATAGGSADASSVESGSGSFLPRTTGVIDSVFSWICSATLRASILAVVVIGLQMMLRSLISPRWRYALWAPVLLVLVLPALPKIPFGFLPAAPSVETDVVAVAPVPAAPTTHEAAVAASDHGTTARPLNAYALIWLAGALCVFCLGVISYRRNLRRIVANQIATDPSLLLSVERLTARVKLGKAPRVVVSTAVDSPAVTGLIRPVLLLPAGFPHPLDEAEAELIVAHELTHLKRRDLWVNWLCCAIQALHWFNPVLWFAFARMRDDRESACDADVLSLDGNDHRATYGHALLKLQSSGFTPALHLGFVGIFEGKAGLRSRIRDISRHGRTHPAKAVAGMTLVAVLLVFGVTEAQEAKPRTKIVQVEKRSASPAQAAIERKLDSIVIPVLRAEDTPLEELVDFLRLRARELDKAETANEKKGVNFVIRRPRPGSGKDTDPGKIRLTMDLRKVTLRKAFEEICAQGDLHYKVDEFAVTFVPATEVAPKEEAAKQPSGKALDEAAKVIIPMVDFHDVRLEVAVDFLRTRAREISPDSSFRIELKASANKDAPIEMLQLQNVPLSEAIRYIAAAAKQSWGADDESIWIGLE